MKAKESKEAESTTGNLGAGHRCSERKNHTDNENIEAPQAIWGQDIDAKRMKRILSPGAIPGVGHSGGELAKGQGFPTSVSNEQKLSTRSPIEPEVADRAKADRAKKKEVADRAMADRAKKERSG